MALTGTNIIGRIALPDDTNPVNSVVRFIMTGFDTDDTENATIIQIPIDAAIDALGDIDVDLWPNPLGVRTTFYSTYARIPDGNTNDVISIYLGQISVPSTGGPYDLNDLLPIAPPAGATVSDYIAQLAAAVASTEANAVIASDSAAAAVISAAQAALYDGVWLDNEAAVLADVVLTYTVSQPGTVAAGNYVQTKDESFSYIVAASGAVDQDVTTAGGVKLYHPKGPYLLVIAGQSNAQGANDGGPNPASHLVKTWNGSTSAWGGSDYTAAPWTLSTPNGNGGNNNVGLARAHRIADDTGRPVFIVYDAVGGTSIDEWVASGTSSARWVALKGKIEAALATSFFTRPGKTTVDEIIWAQGEEDFADDFATHHGNLTLLRNQFRAETWCDWETPIYMMGPSNLHDRYAWQNAMQYFCGKVDNRCIFVPSNGLRTEYSADGVSLVPGSGDYTHFLGESLWEAGYYRIAAAAPSEAPGILFFGRGSGPATPDDPTTLATFSSLVSFDSWTSTTSPNGPAATGSISWGEACVADGNYSFALGYECETDNSSNYTMAGGRDVTAGASGDYALGWGYQIALSNTYTAGLGRGHILADSGGAAVGLFSTYVAAQTDNVMFQVGIGTSTSARKNGIAVRKSGIIEMNNLPTYANNAAAVAGTMAVGQIYKTATGELRIVV